MKDVVVIVQVKCFLEARHVGCCGRAIEDCRVWANIVKYLACKLVPPYGKSEDRCKPQLAVLSLSHVCTTFRSLSDQCEKEWDISAKSLKDTGPSPFFRCWCNQEHCLHLRISWEMFSFAYRKKIPLSAQPSCCLKPPALMLEATSLDA